MPICPSCGEDNPDRARFCLSCATPLTAVARPAHEVRKTVTVVFCDVTGSTSLGEKLDPESLRRVMARYFEEMRAVLERHGGTVEKFIGDAVMAVFGIPQLHEDDALRACRAACEMREALAVLNDELLRDRGVQIQTRTGVNTGEVVAGDASSGQGFVIGDAVNTTARLEQAAQPGEILVGTQTHRLVRDAVEAEPVESLELKGKAGRVAAFRLLSVIPGAEVFVRRLDSPIVGRERELRLLAGAFERAISERACFLFTGLGSAGVGKSRLVEEFLRRVGDRATVLRGRCLPYGDGITFYPVAEVVRAAVSGGDASIGPSARMASLLESEEHAPAVVERLAGLLGDGTAPVATEEIFWAVRTLFEGIAHRRPLVVVFDDVHWGEATFLDLIEHVAEWSHDAPILLLCLARPDLLDLRPGWAGGKMNASSILLEPLSEEESAALIGNLLGAAELPERVGARITEAAEGNPLFVEEMLEMLIDEGLLVRDDERWTPAGDLTSVSVPPTIQALIAARLDRLEDDQRGVIERASVVGKEFWRGAVVELSPASQQAAVPASLMTLVRKELIRPGRSGFAGEDAFRFRHLLIRDAAYESMPKETRADLHERFAAWLERVAGEGVAEFEEILAYHLEQAVRYRAELGPLDDRGVTLAERAAERLASAGRRALARVDMPAAVNLLGRALELVPPDPTLCVPLRIDLADALVHRGELARAEALLDEALEEAEGTGDNGLVWRARLERSMLALQTDPTVSQASVLQTVDRAIDELGAAGDDAGLALAWHHRGLLRFWLGRCSEALEAMERGREHARRARDRRLEEQCIFLYFGPLLWGPLPVPEAAARSEELLAATSNQQVEAFAVGLRSYLAALEGRFEEARHLGQGMLARLQDLGHRLHLATGRAMVFGEVLKMCGDLEEAIAVQTAGVEDLERMGETGYLSTAAGYLADTMLLVGRDDDAERYVEMARSNTAEDDFSSQLLWRSAAGRLLSRRGRHEEAVALLGEAVAIAEPTDYLVEHGDTLVTLADGLAEAGHPEEAVPLVQEAAELYARKGATVLVERARARLDELGRAVQS